MKRLLILSLALLSCGEKEEERKLTERGEQIVGHRPSPEASLEVVESGDQKTEVVPDPPAPGPPIPDPGPDPDPDPNPNPELELPSSPYLSVTEKIHALISEKEPAYTLEPYTESVPLAGGALIEMVPVSAGTLSIRSSGGKEAETEVAPFWIGKHEITWEAYRAFMENGKPRNHDGTLNRDGDSTTLEEPQVIDGETLADIVSQPPPPYDAQHFEMGEGYAPGWPAIAMSQHAASKFCEWLSAQTGHYYRLPTEAEWEYACRAGTSTTYSFGDDPAQLEDFAWTYDNSNFSYQKVGTRKPNPWGIHDMHGNVAEWCLDSRSVDASSDRLSQPAHSAVVRGGSYTDRNPAETMRCDSRVIADPAWNASDPRNPKSIWYLSNNESIGFRLVRPFEVPESSTMHSMWNTDFGASE